MLNLKDGTLWQWDTGRKIIVTLDKGHTIDKVQFYNGIGENAYPATSIESVEGEILAGIPNSLLCYAKNLTVYLMTTDEDGVKTQEQITLVVNKRAKPEDYIFSNDEFHSYQEYEERLQYLEKNIVVPEKLEEAVNDGLKKNVPSWAMEKAPDKTLSESNKAADSAEVGKQLSGMKEIVLNETNNRQKRDEDLAKEIEVQKARIDNLVAPSGSELTLDEEVIDARIDVDGVDQKSLGKHLRNLGKAVKETISWKMYIDQPIDFNTLVNSGTYNILNEAIPDSTNYPSLVGGVLTVKGRTDYDEPVVHELVDNKNRFYTRYKTSLGWSEWESYTSKREFDEHVADSLCYKTYIDSPTNFDEMLTPGIYNILSTAAEGSANYPSAYGGMLTVKKRVGSEFPMTHELIDSEGVFYVRYKTSRGWGKWNAHVSCEKLEEELSVEKHTDCIGPLVEVAETYFNVAYDPNDQLLYESKCGLFNKKTTDEAGVKSIVCSQFEQACIAGISYENSRYVGDKNKALSWGFVSDGTGVYNYEDKTSEDDEFKYSDYMTACEQVRYFESKGLLNAFDINRNRIKPGDLLFFDAEKDTEGNLITDPPYYKKITHVAICLCADKEKYTMMHSTDKYGRMYDEKEASVVVVTNDYTSKPPAYFVHSPIVAEYSTKLLLSKSLLSAATYTGTWANVDITEFATPLGRGFYTLEFDDLGNSLGHIKVDYKQGDKVANRSYHAIKNTTVNKIVFYAEMPVTKITVWVSPKEGNESSNYNCSWVKLYKGYHN